MPGENYRSIKKPECCVTCEFASAEDVDFVCLFDDHGLLRPDYGDEVEIVGYFDLCDGYKRGTPRGWE